MMPSETCNLGREIGKKKKKREDGINPNKLLGSENKNLPVCKKM